jgi:hypothetical protein
LALQAFASTKLAFSLIPWIPTAAPRSP